MPTPPLPSRIIPDDVLASALAGQVPIVGIGGSAWSAARPIELAIDKANANGYRFDGVAGHGAIPDSASQAIGTSDFYIMAVVMMDDWTPSSALCLYSKISGNDGVKLNLTTAGLLQLQIGNGTNFTTYSYSSTAAVPSSDNMAAFVAVTADRDGNAVFYWNGVQLGDPVDMSGSSAQSATAAATAYLFRDGSTYTTGRCVWFALGNYAPDATTVLRYYLGGVPDSDKWGSFAASYTMDASAGADGWAGARATVAGNVDAVSDGSVSKDDTIRAYADATASNTHYAQWDTTELGLQKRYRCSGSIYIPNSGGSTYLDGAWIALGQAVSGGTAPTVNLVTTLGAWTDFSFEGFSRRASAGFRRLSVFGRKSGSSSFTGANSATDDLFYLHGFVLTQLGCVLLLDGNDMTVNTFQWQDSSTNLNDCTIASGSTMLLTRPRGRVRGVTNTNGNQQLLGQTVLPSNAYVTAVYMVAASGTPTVSVGSASAGTQYINAQALSTSWARPTQTNQFGPSQNVWINSNGTMNVTTVVYYELPAA